MDYRITPCEVIGDESGNLWVLSGNSIARWEESSGRFHDVTPKDPKIRYDMFVWQVAADQSGALWLETNDGRRARIVNSDFERAPPKSVIYRDGLENRWTIGVGPR